MNSLGVDVLWVVRKFIVLDMAVWFSFITKHGYDREYDVNADSSSRLCWGDEFDRLTNDRVHMRVLISGVVGPRWIMVMSTH